MSREKLEQLLTEALKVNDEINDDKQREQRFAKLIEAINKEAFYLPKAEREATLTRVFEIRDTRRNT